MTEQEYLKRIQEQWKCEHVKIIGGACDSECSWFTCMCAVAAWKMAEKDKTNA